MDDIYDSDEEDSSEAQLAKGYEYLLGMKIWNLTKEKVDKLQEVSREWNTASQLYCGKLT